MNVASNFFGYYMLKQLKMVSVIFDNKTFLIRRFVSNDYSNIVDYSSIVDCKVDFVRYPLSAAFSAFLSYFSAKTSIRDDFDWNCMTRNYQMKRKVKYHGNEYVQPCMLL